MLRESATGLRKRLVSLGPASVLKRGYAIVRTAQGELVTSVHQVQREDVLELRVTDGSILSQVLTEPTKDINGGNSDD
jgi:exodeoxyribonuclease VII large subunit